MTGVAIGILTLSLAYLTAFLGGSLRPWAPRLLALGIVILVAALLLVGARREGRRLPGVLLVGVAVVIALLGIGFGAALFGAGEGPAAPLLLGLPRRAALVVYGIGLVPVVVLPVVFAKTFAATVLSADDLNRFREQLAAGRKEEGR